MIAHRLEHRVVVSRIDHYRDRLVILRGAPDHRRPPDVDLLDRFLIGPIRFGDGLFERIKIYRHQIDWLETTFARLRFVFRIAAFIEQTTVDTRVQSFHATFENLRKRRETRNLTHRHAFLAQQLGRAAGGNNIDTLAFERARELRDTSLIRNRDEGAADFHWLVKA